MARMRDQELRRYRDSAASKEDRLILAEAGVLREVQRRVRGSGRYFTRREGARALEAMIQELDGLRDILLSGPVCGVCQSEDPGACATCEKVVTPKVERSCGFDKQCPGLAHCELRGTCYQCFETDQQTEHLSFLSRYHKELVS